MAKLTCLWFSSFLFCNTKCHEDNQYFKLYNYYFKFHEFQKYFWSKQDSLEAASLNTVRANPSGGTGSPQVNQSWDLEPPNI